LPAGQNFQTPRQRAVALALALAANLLLIIALLTLNPPVAKPPKFRGSPVLIDLRPDGDPAPADQARSEVAGEAVAKPEPRPEPERPAEVPPPTPLPVPDTRPLPFIVLSREDMLASDIAKLRSSGPAAAQRDTLASAAGGAVPGDSERVGTAPNGEPLYRAEWHRRPTNAELAAYLPPQTPPEGWGLVACRTVARYRVEDCVELDDSPPGSRLAGAVRQAAWQFLVRPPRVGGKPLVGSWVRIRIEYSRGERE
jgi:protein TonB